MNRKNLEGVLLGCAFAVLAGCSNIGNAPTGASADEVKAAVAQQSPMQQIRNVMFSPAPADKKEMQIKELEEKYHVSRNDAMKDLPPPKFSNTPPPEVPTGK